MFNVMLYSLHAQDITMFFSLPAPITGNVGSVYWHVSPALGLDFPNDLNLGFDIEIGREIEDWDLSAGLGAVSNIIAVGGFASYKGYGAGYYASFYGNDVGPDGRANKQIVGGFKVFGKDFSLRLENDFFGDNYDRWRTTALEISIRNFVMGTFVYTNMPDRENANYTYNENYNSSIFRGNRKAYSDGEVYYSIFYIGYRYGNRIIRIGVNHPIIQDITQNGWHTIANKPFFYTPYGQYFSLYVYIGYYNPFSLF
jgi:hypothetical protein